MLFNLGLTADAAAAHENDVSSQTDRSPSPALSFATLPTLGLGSFYNRYKSPEIEKVIREPPRAMSASPVDSMHSSDGDYSTVGAVSSRSRNGRPQAVRKQSSRPKTSYQLAHPASHARHKRLKLRPKLLLQLQRVSQTPRPLPVLDVLPSNVFLPGLSRKFPTIFRGKKGLGPNDLIVVTSDLYERTGGDIGEKFLSPDEEHNDHREVVATICQLLKEDALSKGKAEICLNHGPVWEATPLPNGSYEFVANTENGIQILRWVLRGARNRRVSAPPGTTPQADTKRFTFSVINPNTRRHPVVASMTRNHLEVFDEYAMPTTSGPPLSPTSGMSVISDDSEMDAALERKVMTTDDDLRTLIVVTSIWVAFREGWSHNFRYDDTAMTLNQALCPFPQPSSPTTKPEFDTIPAGRSDRQVSDGPFSPINPPPDRFMTYRTISKRSNSTGAAFIERSNRRAPGTSARRHTNPREGERSRSNKPDKENIKNPKSLAQDTKGFDGYPLQQLDMSNEKTKSLSRTGSTRKCRERIGNMFDFLTRKHH
ncbi:hypothetical protein BDV25DRAFT_130947 [Aspergillus avenaceus]|uniref:Uncharacterized protein n=1 Tax=Aspergillus avenaceus TaxID=36643 RepID=A0A5N6TQZ4_ASPAV|nr:hypothetical protein BDV25DRAFT_130947 [Aspergillus avenaceus]